MSYISSESPPSSGSPLLVVVAALEQLHLVARLLLALDELDDLVDVGVGHERAVEALHARRPRRKKSMSPSPSRRSAPTQSRIVREFVPDVTWNEMRAGKFALMSP
jgi:hypothetical protein